MRTVAEGLVRIIQTPSEVAYAEFRVVCPKCGDTLFYRYLDIVELRVNCRTCDVWYPSEHLQAVYYEYFEDDGLAGLQIWIAEWLGVSKEEVHIAVNHG